MTAPARRWAAGDARDAWHQAVGIRDEWLAHGLSTQDADRAATEHSLSRIYERVHRVRPRFIWVDSPDAALVHIEGLLNADVVLARYIRLKEGFMMQFRAEFFNALNHSNYSLVGRIVNDPTFGQVLSQLDPRQLQFGIKITF